MFKDLNNMFESKQFYSLEDKVSLICVLKSLVRHCTDLSISIDARAVACCCGQWVTVFRRCVYSVPTKEMSLTSQGFLNNCR